MLEFFVKLFFTGKLACWLAGILAGLHILTEIVVSQATPRVVIALPCSDSRMLIRTGIITNRIFKRISWKI